MSNHNFIVNPIVIGSNTIERVMTYKLLGVYVSNDLKWNHHAEVIVQKGNRRLCSLTELVRKGPHLESHRVKKTKCSHPTSCFYSSCGELDAFETLFLIRFGKKTVGTLLRHRLQLL